MKLMRYAPSYRPPGPRCARPEDKLRRVSTAEMAPACAEVTKKEPNFITTALENITLNQSVVREIRAPRNNGLDFRHQRNRPGRQGTIAPRGTGVARGCRRQTIRPARSRATTM